MSKSLNLQQIISKPLGPYPEGLVLNALFPRKGSGFVPRLESVYIDADKQASGLDYTEFVGVSPQNLPNVRFFGVLKVESLGWLSDTGKEYLEAELRERDEEINGIDDDDYGIDRDWTASEGGSRFRSGLTLERLYGSRPGEGSKISVWLCCEKNMAAAFLTNDRYRSSLVLYSHCQGTGGGSIHRTYEIASLDIQTYAKSRNFFERFRLLAFLKTLLDKSTAPRPPPPLEDRTISWLAENMLSYHQTESRHHRYHLRLRSSSSDGSDDADDSDTDMDSKGNTLRPRHLRHVPKSEVYSILASHAEWFLAAQLATSDPRHHYMNLVDLYMFCRRVAGVGGKDGVGFVSLRERARRRKPELKWGWGMEYRDQFTSEKTRARFGSESPNELDLTRFGGTRHFWADKIRRWCMKLRTYEPVEYGLPVAPELEYDSDFSVDSSPPASDSDEADPHIDSDEDDPTSSAHSALRSRFPSYCLYPPNLVPGQFRWDCPHVYGPEDFDDYEVNENNESIGKQCDYSIDLLHISEENFIKSPSVSRKRFEYMKQMKWKSIEPLAFSNSIRSNSRARGIFVDMVSDHYKEHLRRRGIVFKVEESRKGDGFGGKTRVRVKIDDKASLREGRSENHRFPSVKMKMHIEEDIGEDIKAEDVDD